MEYRRSAEFALTTLEHAISYLLQSSESHEAINEACNYLYAAHKAVGPNPELSPLLRNWSAQ
jgi:hypothetical protein